VQGEALAFKGRRRCVFGRLEAKETYVQEGQMRVKEFDVSRNISLQIEGAREIVRVEAFNVPPIPKLKRRTG
jgi:hypothetical protein